VGAVIQKPAHHFTVLGYEELLMIFCRPTLIGVVVLSAFLTLLAGEGTAFLADTYKPWFERKLLIQEGTTLSEAADLLQKEDLIFRQWSFKLLGKLTLSERKIRAGEYLLNSKMSNLDILQMFREGKILKHRVVVVEGMTVREIGMLLAKEGLVGLREFDRLTRDPLFLQEVVGNDQEGLEGYLYPDTYFFYKGQPMDSIFRGMVARFREVYTPELAARAEQLGMTRKEVITLASMIEEEAVVPPDRALISAVFHNRLRKGIPLQSDPTVIYALGEQFNGDLKRKDLFFQSPYNTYVRGGLPPGPIGNPGLPSIKAALYPANADYYYFVSRNDGTHQFSKTIKDHNKAVSVYQRPKNKNKKT
jgi:UPF0755 protein